MTRSASGKMPGDKSRPSKRPERLKATLMLDEPVTRLPGVSAGRAKLLGKLGVRSVRDFLTHFPRRYLDLTQVATAAGAPIGARCTVYGRIHEVKLKRPRYNLPIVEISLVDETGIIILSVFHQPWLKDKLHAGDVLMAAGKIEFNYGFKRMTNPFLEVVEVTGPHSLEGRIVPVHRATEKLPPATLRALEESALEATKGLLDPLPLALRLQRGLVSRGAALRAIHFPKTMGEVKTAMRRLAYEELLFLQLYMMQDSQKRACGVCPVQHVVDGRRVHELDAHVPYRLTDEQLAARSDVLAAMAAPSVMNHMLLGDVGTGKTIVAAFGIAAAVDSGGQAALLAPTEVLARQHAHTLGALFDNIGVSHALLVGSTRKDERARILEDWRCGKLDVLIGTHALLEDDVVASNLTFVVIDEQQRFGVEQRAKMLAKGDAPDALYLTATPIPRTLALTLFGSLTLSYIKERPHPGAMRTSRALPASKRGEAYDAALLALARGEQVYVICPLIGVSSDERDEASAGRKGREDDGEAYHPVVSIEDEGDFHQGNVAAAEQHAKFLQEKVFGAYEVGLLHGGMSADAKADVMERFKTGEVNVLVATTVIEVGVDVPNATVMIVEDADRFGLSQLHQLRGRVGRGVKDTEAYFVSASKQEPALKRLAFLEKSDDGFEIAKFDLSLRREGDILGNRQSGASTLKLVNIMRDADLIEAAHADARAIMDADPSLEAQEHQALAREVRLMFAGDHATTGG